MEDDSGSTGKSQWLLDVIRGHPGCNQTQARRYSGLGRREFFQVLESLVDAGRVHRIDQGNEVLLVPAFARFRECVQELKALLCPHTRRLHRYLSDHDVLPRQDVVAHARHEWGWKPEATRWRLRRLKDADLVRFIMDLRDTRTLLCHAQAVNPEVVRLLDQIKA